jgi:hypothetical protein
MSDFLYVQTPEGDYKELISSTLSINHYSIFRAKYQFQ